MSRKHRVPEAASDTTPTDAPTEAEHPSPEERRNDIGWFRAILSGLGLLLVGIGVGVYGAQAAVEQLTSLSRDQRVWIATTIMTVAIVVMAWLLRRLQSRGLI